MTKNNNTNQKDQNTDKDWRQRIISELEKLDDKKITIKLNNKNYTYSIEGKETKNLYWINNDSKTGLKKPTPVKDGDALKDKVKEVIEEIKEKQLKAQQKKALENVQNEINASLDIISSALNGKQENKNLSISENSDKKNQDNIPESEKSLEVLEKERKRIEEEKKKTEENFQAIKKELDQLTIDLKNQNTKIDNILSDLNKDSAKPLNLKEFQELTKNYSEKEINEIVNQYNQAFSAFQKQEEKLNLVEEVINLKNLEAEKLAHELVQEQINKNQEELEKQKREELEKQKREELEKQKREELEKQKELLKSLLKIDNPDHISEELKKKISESINGEEGEEAKKIARKILEDVTIEKLKSKEEFPDINSSADKERLVREEFNKDEKVPDFSNTDLLNIINKKSDENLNEQTTETLDQRLKYLRKEPYLAPQDGKIFDPNKVTNTKVDTDINKEAKQQKELEEAVAIIADRIVKDGLGTREEAITKASGMASGSSAKIVEDLVEAAKLDKNDAAKLEKKDGDNLNDNVSFATKAFKIKLEEPFDINGKEMGADVRSKISAQIMMDIVEQLPEKKKGEFDQLLFDKNLIDIASDPKKMSTYIESAVTKIMSKKDDTKVDEKGKKPNFYLSKLEKQDLEEKSSKIYESINKYLEAKDEDKIKTKQDLLVLLNPKQEGFSEHPTFQFLANAARDVLDDNKMKKQDGTSVEGRDEMLKSIGEEFLRLADKDNEKDAKGYKGVFENISRNFAVLDQKYNQRKDGLTTRLIGGLSESLEENKESIENEGSDLKKNLAIIFKVAGFATLAAVGGPFGIVAGLLFIYFFRNLGEQKSQEQIERDEEFERNKQELMAARMAVASRYKERENTMFPESEEINKKIAEEAEKDLRFTQHKLEENKNNLENQKIESQKNVKENAETFKKIKDNIKELNKDSNPMLKKFSKDDSIQEKKSKSFVELALKEEEKVARKSREI